MSFPLQTLLKQPVNGFYKLQSQACLLKPQPPFLLPSTCVTAGQTQQSSAPTAHNSNQNTVTHYQIHTKPQPLQPPALAAAPAPSQPIVPESGRFVSVTTATNAATAATMTSTLTRQKSDEDVMSIDSMAQATAGNNIEHPMTLSRKALHQRDADENLFLRFLELDPPTEASAPTTAANATPSSGRRLSSSSKAIGRTPFTMTKKLTRTAERGFGFSIVWTHPPRVEKIEPGLSADRAGIQPGDYVIFVDKQNVVTMPEADVLNLIRSQGSTLTLEVFRRTGPAAGGGGGGGGVSGGVGLASMPSMPPALSVGSRGHPTAPVMNGKASSSTRLASAVSDEQQSVTGGLASTTQRRIAVASALPSAAVGTNAGSTMTVAVTSAVTNARPSTACSGGTTSSIEAAKRRLHLPQVTFSKESIGPITDNRRRLLLQLISREQNFISALHFGMQRFVQPLIERKDLISPNDHRTLFQNIDELLRISEDILEQLCNDDQEPQMNFASRVYLSKTTAICAAYKKYCNGIKRADCVLVNKSRQMGSDFVAFITEPQVPRKRPDLTMFIHRPLQHFREILKLMQLLASNCHVDTEEHKNFTTVIAELQAAYREITVSSGLMEPLGEGRPLLTLQDLESRMVFTKCKPFTLAVQGRQWIFGGDLSRVEGRSVKPYWTLLFSDIIVFAKVSRDRVLFITEEPIPIANIVDSCFHMRKKTTEFRLTVDPNGRLAESPTGYCAPDLTRTPKKSARRKSLLLRAPSLELKAVWQNLLQRQIFLVNAALGSTPLSSPLDSPDVLNTLVPLSDIGIASASIGSVKHSSMDSINAKNSQQQVRLLRHGGHLATGDSYENLQRLASTLVASRCSTRMTQTTRTASCSSQTASPARHTLTGCLGGHVGGSGGGGGCGILTDSAPSLRSLTLTRRHLVAQQLDARPLAAARAYNSSANNSSTWLSLSGSSLNTQTLCSGEHLPTCKCLTAIPEAACEATSADAKHDIDTFFLQQRCADGGERLLLIDGQGRYCVTTTAKNSNRPSRRSESALQTTQAAMSTPARSVRSAVSGVAINTTAHRPPKLLEFSLSSVGRSFIDETDVARPNDSQNYSLTTPETPTPNISPSSQPCNSDAFSNDFVPTQNIKTQENEKPKQLALNGDNAGGKINGNAETQEMLTKPHPPTKDIPLAQFGGSWDLVELDMNLQEVNIDPSYDTDVEECIFMADEHELDEDDEIDVSVVVDDPFGVLPTKPTPPDSLDL